MRGVPCRQIGIETSRKLQRQGASMRTIQCAIRTGRSLVLGLAVLALSATSARAAGVLDQVPSDAAVVWKINHLQDTSTKLAGLFQSLGITDFVPMMADPLA